MHTPRPLIVLCAPRSFSSVTAAMLGQHPGLYAFPELNLFTADSLGELLDREQPPTPVGAYLGGLARAVAELEFGGQTAESILRARQWIEARRGWSTPRVLNFLMASIAPRALVDKSPRTALASSSCRRAEAMPGQARFLHLTRHPATSIRSLSATVTDRGSHVNRAFAQIWLSCQASILELTERLEPAATLRVRGEDIVRQPDETLSVVLGWLGLPIDRDCLEGMKHPERSPFAFPIPGLEGDNDSEFLQCPRLQQAAADVEPETLADLDLGQAITGQVADLAARLGYAVIG